MRSEEHTSELQSLMATLFPYTTLFRSIHSNDFSGAYRGKCTFSGSYYQPAEYDDDCFGTCNSFEVEEFIVPDSYEEYEDELCEKFITKNDEEIKKCLEESAEFC